MGIHTANLQVNAQYSLWSNVHNKLEIVSVFVLLSV